MRKASVAASSPLMIGRRRRDHRLAYVGLGREPAEILDELPREAARGGPAAA